MPDLFKNEKNFITIDKKFIDVLKRECSNSEKNMSRLLMHLSTEDNVQEMLICFGKKTLIPPNKSSNKSESLHVIEGKLLLIIFDDNGKVNNKIIMKPYGDNESFFIYRFNKCEWHTMIALTDNVVVHEILEGPFAKSENEIPIWIPKNRSDLKKFLEKIK